MPPTAAPRVLSLDGGGIRGLASLQFLQVLQDLVGLPYPIQYHFDIVYGTSSGHYPNSQWRVSLAFQGPGNLVCHFFMMVNMNLKTWKAH
uniref:PNPLA domain-containing protein n=1 Tax=Bionectria ochroleuca TaxID=29856 RepID=A0A0B7KPB2_BIOOC